MEQLNTVEIWNSRATTKVTKEEMKTVHVFGVVRILNLSPVSKLIEDGSAANLSKFTELSNETSLDLMNEEKSAKSWANMFVGNCSASSGMPLAYIPPTIVDGN
ncbi:hypothetical protein HAX54_000222, partial [Datura stramonium]|nr:hypothetical protein [Datura stramonium]